MDKKTINENDELLKKIKDTIKETIMETIKEYYQENKEKMRQKEYKNKIVKCPLCSLQLKRNNLNYHKKKCNINDLKIIFD